MALHLSKPSLPALCTSWQRVPLPASTRGRGRDREGRRGERETSRVSGKRGAKVLSCFASNSSKRERERERAGFPSPSSRSSSSENQSGVSMSFAKNSWTGGKRIVEEHFSNYSAFVSNPWWFNQRSIDVQTTADKAVCEKWIREFRESGSDCLGVDIEWKANTVKHQKPEPVATLQLATEHSALILQVLYFKPDECEALRDLMSDSRVIKLGVGIKQDFVKLAKDCNLHCAGGLDLSKYFKKVMGLVIKEDIGLKRLAKFVLASNLEKPKMLSRSDWSTARLEKDQIKYAALDAVIASKIFHKLRSCDSYERFFISLRTNYYLQRSFASRKVKSFPVSKRLLVFGALLLLLWAPSLLVAKQFARTQVQKDAVYISWGILSMMGLIHAWGEEMYKYRKPIWAYMGQQFQVKALSQGLVTGVVLTSFFYFVLWFFGYGMVLPGNIFIPNVLHAAGVGLLVGFTEEILFRGFMQKELERDFKAGSWKATLLLGLIFSLLHLSREAFLGLVLLSLCLSEAKKFFGGSLSYPIGLHSSLVATNMLFNGNAFVHTSAAPLWLFGNSVHGPHSGLLGIGLLGVLYLGLCLTNKQSMNNKCSSK